MKKSQFSRAHVGFTESSGHREGSQAGTGGHREGHQRLEGPGECWGCTVIYSEFIYIYTGWWFGTFFFHILGIVTPTDFYIYQRG